MLRVGLTGGIAAGKTAVSEMLAARGAHVIYADRVAHELMRPGQSVYARIVERFGRDILSEDGQINRTALAALAFADKRNVEDLNRIVHPSVIEHQERWMDNIEREVSDAIAVVEAALIFEAGLGDRFDKVITVACSKEQKVERLARRMGVDLETAHKEVERRSSAQMSDEEKASRADYVIDNSGPLEDTERQVDKLFSELRLIARSADARTPER